MYKNQLINVIVF